MIWNPFEKLVPKKYLGIDIGTSFIKIVEISEFGNRRKLENYGEIESSALYEKPFRTFNKSTLFLSSKDIAKAINAVREEANMKTFRAVFSIPDFSTFFTNFKLPLMDKEELPQAVRYQARQLIPLPLAEITLDWQLIEDKASEDKKSGMKILLAAVPNEVINQYQEIARLAKIEMVALEAEVFGLTRALIKDEEKDVVAIIDIGAQSTTCNIVDKKILKTSYSFDVSSNELTEVISKGVNVDYKKAEDLKRKYGVRPLETIDEKIGQETRQALLPLVDLILREIEKIFNNFFQTEKKEIKKIVLAGGLAFMPGLSEYFAQKFDKEIEIANPFLNVFCPPILEQRLKEMGPSYAIAVGMALRELKI
ncbi:MAG: type IV pilus assembly protein PilM [Parcubacteria group bacterium]|nr:MAG: type IV pilus assembly protein PilM [Parcubacteria group bacterium]